MAVESRPKAASFRTVNASGENIMTYRNFSPAITLTRAAGFLDAMTIIRGAATVGNGFLTVTSELVEV